MSLVSLVKKDGLLDLLIAEKMLGSRYVRVHGSSVGRFLACFMPFTCRIGRFLMLSKGCVFAVATA